jgi:hypothetical protein
MTFASGRSKATIWRHVIGDAQAPHCNAAFSRLSHDGQRWRDATSFGRDDLLLLAELSRLACLWIDEHGGGVAPESRPLRGVRGDHGERFLAVAVG